MGLALEAIEAADTDGFQHFCQEMAAPHLDLSGWSLEGQVTFQTLRGRRLEMTYDGAHRVDGQEIDYSTWPLYEAPGVTAPLGSGRVAFRRGSASLELDFGVDPEKTMLPIRVIG